MSVVSLLPPHRTALDAALEQTLARQLDPSAIARLWDPETCQEALLPWLAWAYSVDEWDDAWPEPARRAVIADSVAIHKRKGTPSAIRRVMSALGFGEVEIIEGRAPYTHDGTQTHSGGILHGGDVTGWAWYEIRVMKLLNNAQADAARAMLRAVAPARCHLWSLNFTAATLLHNGIATRDGAYNHGEA